MRNANIDQTEPAPQGRRAGMLVVVALLVVAVAVLVRPTTADDPRRSPERPPAAILTQPPTGAHPLLPDQLEGIPVETLRLAVEVDDVAVFVGPLTDPATDVCMVLVVGDGHANGCQRMDPSPVLASLPFAEPSREVIVALVADGYDEAVLADDRVVPIRNNVVVADGQPPMVQGITLRGPAGEHTANLGARNEGPDEPEIASEGIPRVGDVCGLEPVPPPGADPPANPQLSAIHVDVTRGNPSGQPSSEGSDSFGPPASWREWLTISPAIRFPKAELDLIRVDGPSGGLCATLQVAAASPGARTVSVGGTTGVIANNRILLWLATDELMLQLVSYDPAADDGLVQIAERVRLLGPREVQGPLPDSLGVAVRGDRRRLDILTADGQTTFRDERAFAPGDEPVSLALIDDTLITYGGDTYALYPGGDRPERIGESTYFLPAGDLQSVWLISGGTSTADSDIATLVDARGAVLSGPHQLPAGMVPQGGVGDGLLLYGDAHGYWTPEDGVRPIDAGETLLATRSEQYATCRNRCSRLSVHTAPDDLNAEPGYDITYTGTGAFSPDGWQLALPTGTPEDDVDVLIMDLERAHSFTIQLDFEDVPELAFGPDGQLVAVGDGEVVIIDGQDSVSVPLPDDIQRVTDIEVLRSALAVQFAGS